MPARASRVVGLVAWRISPTRARGANGGIDLQAAVGPRLAGGLAIAGAAGRLDLEGVQLDLAPAQPVGRGPVAIGERAKVAAPTVLVPDLLRAGQGIQSSGVELAPVEVLTLANAVVD